MSWRGRVRGSPAAALPAVLGLMATMAANTSTPAAPQREVARPSLIVVIVVDMLPSGKLETLRPLLSGGFRRLLDAGRIHPACAHAHAATLTAPGHATLLSGLLPRHHGVIMNEWYDLATHREVYCVESRRQTPPDSVGVGHDRSADNLLGDSFADLLKRSDPRSLVYGVAGKDRSAILSAGHAPDGTFWYDENTGSFTGNPGANARLPEWGREFWAVDPGGMPPILKRVPDAWTYPQRPEAHPDDDPYEILPRVAPHNLRAAMGTSAGGSARSLGRRIEESPWMDWLTLELASKLLEEKGLGRDAAPDLLVVALASADHVGHRHGPDSQEYVDTIIRVDGWLGDFMKRAEAAAVRTGGVVFALSSDHGVLPLPETRSGARRVDPGAMMERLQRQLSSRLDPGSVTPFVEASQGGHIYLDRRALAASGVSLEKAVEEARRILLGFWEVARVYRASDLASGEGGDLYLALYRASWHPDRGGDLVVQPCRECLFTSRAEGTSHGTPYDYDRLVPLILMGPGIGPGQTDAACRTVDLAPTLARLLGLTFTTPRDGRALPLSSEGSP